LESSISYIFAVEGMNTVTVQVSAGNTLIQDTKEIAVHGTLSLLQSDLRGYLEVKNRQSVLNQNELSAWRNL